MTPRFWVDTSTFITLDREYYHHDMAPGFWSFVDQQAEQGTLRSCRTVHDEIAVGSDWLSSWATQRSAVLFPHMEADPSVQAQLKRVTSYVYSSYDHAFASAFVDGADPWLVAITLTYGGVLVTEETRRTQPIGARPNRRASVKLLDVCAEFDVAFVRGHHAAKLLGLRLVLDPTGRG